MQQQKSLITDKVKLKVSSTLNRDSKQFGKQFLIDGSNETCWNSDQGSPQWIIVDWDVEVFCQALVFEFQGGFAGKTCKLLFHDASKDDYLPLMDFYPTDSTQAQTFSIPPHDQRMVKRIKIVFEDSTDFYGRITIYKMDVMGMPKNFCPF